MLKVTLSGASGYIGSRIIKNLKSKRVYLTALKNKRIIKSNVIKKNFFIGNKIKKNLFKKINKPDVFVHLAWPDLNDHNSKKHFETEKKHYYFLKNLIDHGLKNLIVTGTCFEYGNKNIILKENLKIDKPITSYGIAKNNLRLRLLKLKKKKILKLLGYDYFLYTEPNINPNSNQIFGRILLIVKKKTNLFFI